jgi:hypothetical protein
MRGAVPQSNEELRRIQGCWLRVLIVLVAVGVCLGPIGLGRSRLGLGAFLAVFVAVSVGILARALRPRVRLADSMNQLAAARRQVDIPGTGPNRKF